MDLCTCTPSFDFWNSVLMLRFYLDLLRDEEGMCPKCRKNCEELENVKEEFERYKLRAQSVLKNKNAKV